jgi:hypothetical protein
MTKRVLGVLAALSMLGGVACSSSETVVTPRADGGGTADTGAPKPVDGGGDVGGGTDGGADTSVPTDDTVGKACTSDEDCDTTGAQLTWCTQGLYTVGPLNPTGVCVGLDRSGGNADVCQPSDDMTIRFCDGPTNVGLCQKSAPDRAATCEPMCQMKNDGTWQKQCAGKNGCNPELFADDSGKVLLIGTCQGGCTADADCPTGSKCDATQNICLKNCTTNAQCGTLTGVTNWGCDTARGHCTFKYTKKTGDTCANSDECPCLKRTSDATGVCTEICKTGSTGECPTGFVCDTLLPLKGTSGDDLWSFPGGNLPAGLNGYCTKTCTGDAECEAIGAQFKCLDRVGGGKTCGIPSAT